MVKIIIISIGVIGKMVFLRIMLPEEEEETKVAFGRGNSGGRGSKLFIYCAFTNHTVDECYIEHGYPLGH